MSQSKVKAGEGYVEIGIKNRIMQGAAGVQADLDKLSKNATALGAKIAAGSAALLAFPIKSASEMQETMGKFEVVFGSASESVKVWSDTTAKAVGVSRQAMLGMLGSMQDLLVPMGVLPDEATGMSKTLSALAVDLASFNNMDTAMVFENLMSAITGEGQVMKKYGVILTEAATKQELFNMGLDPKTADNAAKAQARLNIIMRGTTAAQGDAIRTASSFANQMKILWSSVIDASSAIGGAFLDDTAAMVSMAHKAVSVLTDFVTKNQEIVRVAALATIAIGGIGVGLVATGVAAKIAASTIGTAMMAAKVAAVSAAVAWSGVALAFSIITLKSRITAAVITAGWQVASRAVSIAWTAATGAIGIALQGLQALLSTAAVVTPWLVGAAAVATAWLGVDAVMTALSVAAAGAWAASAATVTAAWTASAAFLTPIAVAITGAWTASATFIGTAWAALSGVFAASGIAGVASATLASAAWTAFGAVTAILAVEQSASAAIVALAWAGASFLASAAWTGFTAILSAALAPASLMAAAGFFVSGAWTVAATLASAAWATAWAIISGPVLPFIAAAGVVVAVVGAMAAGVAILAARSLDFGAAFTKAKSVVMGFASIVTTTFDAIKGALLGGDYAAAAQALWLGVQLAFWEGVSGAMDAFSWLWKEAALASQRFMSKLLSTVQSVMAAVVTAITNPYKAAKEISAALADLATSIVSFSVDDRASAARKELAAIRDRFAKSSGGSGSGSGAGETGNGGAGLVSEADTKAFDDKIAAIELEILALEKGEAAADRKRLADERLNDEQIKQVQQLKAKKEALEAEADAQKKATKAAEDAAKKASEKRAEGIFKRADQLSESGMMPAEIFKQVMAQIDSDQKSGKLDKETADESREKARGNLDDRAEALRREGQALAEALRTPAETLKAKLGDINKLQSVGAIDSITADRAIADAKKTFAEEEERNKAKTEKVSNDLEQEQKRSGPSGSFSASGAAIIGASGGFESESLKAQRAAAENTGMLVKQNKKNQVARFG